MSGGHFEYQQRNILDIADTIRSEVDRNGKKKTKEEIKEEGWRDPEWYSKYPEDLYHYKYPNDVIEEFKKAIPILKTAYVYAQRIDWLLSGDDGEESFLKRLKEELKQIDK